VVSQMFAACGARYNRLSTQLKLVSLYDFTYWRQSGHETVPELTAVRFFFR
jgi:hypothetical protein